MRFHPYPFKGRIFQRFPSLLVITLRHMRMAHELDVKMANSAAEIKRLKNELNELKGSIKKGEKDKNLEGKIDKKVEEIKKDVRDFCKNIRGELKDFNMVDIDDYTLIYREAKYLRMLANKIKSKKIDNNVKGALKKWIKDEMLSLERKARALELLAKYLERGLPSTVALSQIRLLGNTWLERVIKIKAIEVNALHKRLESDAPERFFKDFEKEAVDVYEIGSNTNILMKRLKATFDSMKVSLSNMGISFPELEKTQKFFKDMFKRIERMGKHLRNEIEQQANKLDSKLKAA